MAIGTATAILGAAGIGFLGSQISGSNQRSALESSTQSQIDAQDRALAVQQSMQHEMMGFEMDMFNKQMGYLQGGMDAGTDYINEGYAAARVPLRQTFRAGRNALKEGYGNAMDRLEPLSDPWALDIAKDYFANPEEINKLPGVEWQKEEGIKALQNAFSRTTGGGLSGNKIRAAEEFGQNYASTQLDNAINRLIPFINLSTQTTGTMAGLDVSKGQDVASQEAAHGANMSALAVNQANALANLEMGGAGSMVAAAGSVMPMVAAGYNNLGNIGANYAQGIGNIQSNNAIAGANIGTSQMSYLTDLIGGSLMGLAYNNSNQGTQASTFTSPYNNYSAIPSFGSNAWWNSSGNYGYT